ncbi:hypothetical protein [Pseudomonas sp. CLCA07]
MKCIFMIAGDPRLRGQVGLLMARERLRSAKSRLWLEQWQMCTYALPAGRTDHAERAAPTMVRNNCSRSAVPTVLTVTLASAEKE